MSKGLLVVFLATLNVTTVASAQPSPEDVGRAEQLFDEGVAASDRGDFAAALTSFEGSYNLNPLPDVLYNIAMCHKALADLPAALNAFKDYVAAMGGNLAPEEQAEFDVLLAELVPQVGRLVLESTEAAAQVRVDGSAVGTTPLGGWHAVAPGQHRIEVSKPGFEPYVIEVDVAAGQTLPIGAPLVALAVVPPVGPGPVPPVGPEPTDDEGGLSPWFWTCVGLAGASALTMAITGGLTLKYNDDFDAGGRTDADLRDTTLALRTTTDVFMGIGLAAVIVGTVLFFVDPDDEAEEETSSSAMVAVLPSGLMVSW